MYFGARVRHLLHHQRDATVSDEELLYDTAGCH